jgi:hypothetical protein
MVVDEGAEIELPPIWDPDKGNKPSKGHERGTQVFLASLFSIVSASLLDWLTSVLESSEGIRNLQTGQELW